VTFSQRYDSNALFAVFDTGTIGLLQCLKYGFVPTSQPLAVPKALRPRVEDKVRRYYALTPYFRRSAWKYFSRAEFALSSYEHQDLLLTCSTFSDILTLNGLAFVPIL